MTLQRFIDAQTGTHDQALAELQSGRKVTHWIWWEMPQLASLGRSLYARKYGLDDLNEASEYLAHPVLRAHLIDLCEAMMSHKDTKANQILGEVDALKVRSMATLFASVSGAPPIFTEILDAFYDGTPCPLTKAEL